MRFIAILFITTFVGTATYYNAHYVEEIPDSEELLVHAGDEHPPVFEHPPFTKDEHEEIGEHPPTELKVPDGTILFSTDPDAEHYALQIRPNGEFIIGGRLVTTDIEVYLGMKRMLAGACGCECL